MSPDTIRLIIEVLSFFGAVFIGAFTFIGISNKKIESLREEFDKRLEHQQKNQAAEMKTFIQLQDDKMRRIYERMDERAAEVEKTYVRMDVHNLTIEHMNQKTDDKFNNIVEKFELKLAELTRAVQKLVNSDEKRNP